MIADSHQICPICFGKLEVQESESYQRIMDASTILQCQEEKSHRFWRHPFSFRILHLNPEATQQNHKWLKAYEYDKELKNVIAIHVNEEMIGVSNVS